MIIKDFKFYNEDEDAEKYESCYILVADFKTRTVTTNCGDFYYDYSIDFDDFIKFAKYIEETDRKLNHENRS